MSGLCPDQVVLSHRHGMAVMTKHFLSLTLPTIEDTRWSNRYGEWMMDGDWIIETGITDAEQREDTAATGVIRLQRWEVGGFRA
ncbi:NAD-dependent epimerase/dehydratase family protein [Yersinia ruckeri]|nr:NAD-dependent epimerase/dehydratase family protein [Yersinia ruckeri]MCW6569760.1 NAD-dependent epimerase/dehydratase family protein [Yersinia ruckeri]